MRYGQPPTGPPRRRYTDSDIDAANDTDLPDLLASLGYQVRRVGGYYTTKEMDSLRIRNRRTWYRYSEGKGGDAIEFLRHFEGKTFPEAVDFLLAWNGRSRDPPDLPPPVRRKVRPAPAAEPVPFVLPPAHGDTRRVTAYLEKRGIAPAVIRGFLDAGLLYEEAGHHNCVFVGKNSDGTPVFAAQRGTSDRDGAAFRGGVPGSDKEIGFRLLCDPAMAGVAVFEAPIDLMSWFTLHEQPVSNAVALCGLWDGPLETYLHENPHLRRITLCLDADDPGREAAQKLSGKYRALGYDTETRFPPSGKDWNEHLKKSVGRAG